ncbi:MAG: ABC transporter ATP-binding protein [Phycisphaerales bacterium]|nr:MAG: ABC transporter ATP-binding protein [Phycisphaerales bacterium]
MKDWRMRLLAHALPQWQGLLVIVSLMLAGASLNALKPWPMKFLVDYVLGTRPMPDNLRWMSTLPGGDSAIGQCAWCAAATLLIFVVFWAAQTTQAYVQSGVALRTTYSLGARLFEHLQRLSLRFHGRRPAGDLVRRVTRDSRCARDIILDVVMPGLTSLATLSFMLAIMWQLNPGLTIAALVVLPPMAIVNRWLYRPMMERTYDQQQAEGQMTSQMERTLTALPVVKAFSREAHEEIRFRETTNRTLRSYFQALKAQLKFRVSIGGLTAIGQAGLLVLGGYHVLQGSLTVGGLLVFVAYLKAFYDPLATLSQLTAALAATEACAKRVFEVLDEEDLIRDEHTSPVVVPPPAGRHGALKFERVTFGYESGMAVLQDISLDIQPGETVALVGPTGAGKTTLVSLAIRFFDPGEGRVLMDGTDLRQLPLPTVRAQVAILLQDPFILPVSIAENIAFGRPDATQAEIAEAAKAANADIFISRLAEGYDTLVGERGATLSGGEKQRLAIARALLKDAAVLILDEPTSALDARTERQLMEALERLTKSRTTLIIAHRLSTIRNADRVVVLEGGRVVQVGSHDELMASGGLYRDLYKSQFGSPQAKTGT